MPSASPVQPRPLPHLYRAGCAILCAGVVLPFLIAALHNLLTCKFLLLPPALEPSLTAGGRIHTLYIISGVSGSEQATRMTKREVERTHAALANESRYWTCADRLWRNLTPDHFADLPARATDSQSRLVFTSRTNLPLTGQLRGYGVGYTTAAGEPRTLILVEDHTQTDVTPLHEVTLAPTGADATNWQPIRHITLGFRSTNPDENLAFPQIWLLLTVVLLPTCCLTGAAILAHRRRTIAKRTAAHRCIYCTYDLSATTSPICPECGNAYHFQVRSSDGPQR